jgi:hypothetical protein
MATLAALRQRVLDNLYSARLVERPFLDTLTASYTGGGTTIAVSDGTNWARGDILENSETGEQMYVLSVATNNLTVRRGYDGTTTSTSIGTDDFVAKNPRFSVARIDSAITAILQELEGYGLHGWGKGAITLAVNQYTYDLTDGDELEVVAAYYLRAGDALVVPLPFRFHKNLHATVVASGKGIDLWYWGERIVGETVYYTYKSDPSVVANLLSRQEELVVLGASGRIIGSTVATRTHDPGKFTDRTVQPGQGVRDARFFQTEYLLAVRREQAQLKVEAKRFPSTMMTSRSSRWRA